MRFEIETAQAIDAPAIISMLFRYYEEKDKRQLSEEMMRTIAANVVTSLVTPDPTKWIGVITMKKHGKRKVIGGGIVTTATNLYGETIAKSDCLYVEPKYRSFQLLMESLKKSEETAKALGAKFLFVDVTDQYLNVHKHHGYKVLQHEMLKEVG